MFRPLSLCVLTLAVAACTVPSGSPEATRPSTLSGKQLVASIREAGKQAESVINVHALQDPTVAALQQAAQAQEQAGRADQAAATLDHALQLEPDSPDLLQQRAEVAVLRGEYDRAERLAHRSWSIGPQLGPLCARNWQTVAEMRQQAGDTAGAASARRWVQACRKPGINRY